MTSAMSLMITSACLSFSNINQEACNKAAEAGAKQSGFEQNIETVQKGIEKEADHKAHYILGDTGMEVVGGGIFLAKTVVDKSVNFNLPTLGMCDRITNHVGVDKYSLELVWGF